MDDLIRLGETHEAPIVDLTNVHQPVEYFNIKSGATLNDEICNKSINPVPPSFSLTSPGKHKTNPIVNSCSNAKVPKLSGAGVPHHANNDIYTTNFYTLKNTPNCFKIPNCTVTSLDMDQESSTYPRSCNKNSQLNAKGNATLKDNLVNKLNNNRTVPDNDNLFSIAFEYPTDLVNLDQQRDHLNNPSYQPSKKPNCTITSREYSLLSVSEQVPKIAFNADSCQTDGNSNKNNFNKTNIETSLNVDTLQPLLIEDSTPSRSNNKTNIETSLNVETLQPLLIEDSTPGCSNNKTNIETSLNVETLQPLLIEDSTPSSSNNKTNIETSLNVETLQPLVIDDSTPSFSNNAPINHNSIQSMPIDLSVISNEQSGSTNFHENNVIKKTEKVPASLILNTALLAELPESYAPLLEIFTDIDVNFLKQFTYLGFSLEQIIDQIMEMNNDYPKCQKRITPVMPNSMNVTSTAITNPVISKNSSFISDCTNASTSWITPYEPNILEQNLLSSIEPVPNYKTEEIDLSSSASVETSMPNDCESSGATVNNQIKTEEPSKFDILQEVLPNADPDFLQEISKYDNEKMRTIVNESLETNNYPKLIKVTPKEEENEDENIELYSTDFDIDKFLKIFPNPCEFFKNPSRVCQVNAHSLEFLKKRFRKISNIEILKVYKKHKYNLSLTCDALDKERSTRKTNRSQFEIRMPDTLNLPFLQEACYIEHMTEIKCHIEKQEEMKKAAYDLAKERGELIECGCCYDQVMFENCATCSEGDLFCKSCIRRSAEVRIGDGLTTFPCLSDCDSNFTLQTLQDLLEARTFSKLLQRIQMEEVRSADIEGLEMCPFCEFATIPPSETRIFTCMNPDCLKESCRACHKVNHIPLRCEEVENDDQAKARKYIEDEMTKALVRECHSCKKSFIKTDGCNKMTCTCGAKMCYICRQPIQDYKHFNGPGGSESNKCPLYSSDNVLHVDAVKEVAQKAMQQVTASNPSLKLKHDPTKLLPAAVPANQLPTGVVENPHVLLQRMLGYYRDPEGIHPNDKGVNCPNAENQAPNNLPPAFLAPAMYQRPQDLNPPDYQRIIIEDDRMPQVVRVPLRGAPRGAIRGAVRRVVRRARGVHNVRNPQRHHQ